MLYYATESFQTKGETIMKFAKLRISEEQVKRTRTVLENMDPEQVKVVWDTQRIADFDGYSTAALVFGVSTAVVGLCLKGIAKSNNFDKIIKMIE